MRLNDFAVLERGERIVVIVYELRNASHEEVFTVTGEPFDANTLVPAVDETGHKHSIYFRDVLRRF